MRKRDPSPPVDPENEFFSSFAQPTRPRMAQRRLWPELLGAAGGRTGKTSLYGEPLREQDRARPAPSLAPVAWLTRPDVPHEKPASLSDLRAAAIARREGRR
jgi:hypothetical protein